MKALDVTSWIAVALLGVVGCGRTDAPSTGRPIIVTTILPVHCIAANIAGDKAEVVSLMSAAADVHDFQMTPRDRQLINRASLVIANGLGLEPWLRRVVKESGKFSRVVELSAGLEGDLIHSGGCAPEAGTASSPSHQHQPGDINPHVWLDPQLYRHMVTNCLAAMQAVDPANSPAYSANASAYLDRLQKLDTELHAGFARLTNAPIITYHDAFPYLTRRFGLRVVGVVEETIDVAPTPKHFSKLRTIIEKEGVKALFTEPQRPDKLARRLADDLKLRVQSLDTLETGVLTPTAYEDGMRRNLQSLQEALK